MKSDKIWTICVIIITILVLVLTYKVFIQKDKIYIQKWVCPETGVVYYVSDLPLYPIYNADGTLYVEDK